MKVNKEKFLSALKAVQPGLAGKEIIKQSTHFCFGEGHVTTYNDEISVRHPIPCKIKGAVLADVLLKILEKMNADKEGNLFFEQTETELLITNGRKAKAGIIFQADVILPLEELDFSGLWKKIPEDFKEAVRFSLFSTSEDTSFPIARCLSIEGNQINTTDQTRVTRYIMAKEMQDPFLLLNTSARYMLNFNVQKYMVTEEWVHFLTPENAIFSCRIMQETFPNLDELLALEGTAIVFPKKTQEIVNRANIFSEQNGQENNFIHITFSDSQVTIKGTATTGWFEETTKGSYKGEEFTIVIAPDFLLDILPNLRSCIIDEQHFHIKFSSEKWDHTLGLHI